MENFKIAFQTIFEGKMLPNVFQYVNCNVVFDIEMEYFHRKAHLVAGGHVINIPDVIT